MTEFEDYRDALKASLLEKKSFVRKTFTFQNMAKACHIQKTYLSMVLGKKGHLNSDQLYLASDYLGLNDDEREYLFLLLEEARTVVAKRKHKLRLEIQRIRKKHMRSENYLDSKVIATNTADLSEYYLTPYLQIVHMFLTIDRFAKNTTLISEKLHFDPAFLADLLRRLQSLGLIEIRDDRYHVVMDNIHLSKDSALFRPYRTLMRTAANDRITRLPIDKSYNFSVIFSTDHETKQKVQNAFLDFLQIAQDFLKNTKAQEVYQMNFDLLSWSD